MTTGTLAAVHVLTGFLGSGKTTLLNVALESGLGPETAVVVNEFGDAGLDPLFLQGSSEETVVLKSGCVCCTIRSDLPSTLMDLLARREAGEAPLRRIVIETSGVSEPLPILATLRSDFNLRARCRIGAVVCTVDASSDEVTQGRHEALAQVTAADAIVVTKGDLAGQERADATRAAALALNPLADVVADRGGDFVRWLTEWEEAAGDPAHATRALEAAPTPHAAHAHGVASVAIRAAAPPSWPQFAVWLTRVLFLHGDRILRVKGVLFDQDRNVWIGIHAVKRFLYPPVHLALPAPPEHGTALVFITEHLDPTRIEQSWRRMAQAK